MMNELSFIIVPSYSLRLKLDTIVIYKPTICVSHSFSSMKIRYCSNFPLPHHLPYRRLRPNLIMLWQEL